LYRLINDLTVFCNKQEIIVPSMAELYADYIRSHAGNEIIEHHYRYDIFTSAVDQQAKKLNHGFSELLTLCASKFYPTDFSEQERNTLRLQLQHYKFVYL
jgi:hypothetical protein